MKSFRINLEDRVQIGRTSSKSLSHGRPKKGVPRKKIYKIEPKDIESKFYLKVVNLKEKEIQKFIHDYQVTLPWMKDGTNFAVPKDIIDFQKEIKTIIENVEKFKQVRKIKKARTHLIIQRLTNDLSGLLNKYLADCHLQIDFPPIISKELSKNDLDSYKNQVKNFTPESTGFLLNDVLAESGYGTNFSNLFCHCDSLLSWCVLDLVIDLLEREELIRVCENCGRTFKAENLKTKYCQDVQCRKEVDKIRQRRSRSH